MAGNEESLESVEKVAGLGPKESSLLERLGRPTEPAGDTLWYMMEQQKRGEARQLARIRHQQKHKTPKKPEAPVKQTEEKVNLEERLWEWVGEPIASKQLVVGHLYSSGYLRKVGFKLPKLQKQKQPEAPVAECKATLDGKRLWTWVGEAIPSKGLFPWPMPKPEDFFTHFYRYNYTSEQIRAAGFGLPKLQKQKKPKQGKAEQVVTNER